MRDRRATTCLSAQEMQNMRLRKNEGSVCFAKVS